MKNLPKLKNLNFLRNENIYINKFSLNNKLFNKNRFFSSVSITDSSFSIIIVILEFHKLVLKVVKMTKSSFFYN